jgi:exopolysaccharide production protein ExoQ
MPPQIATLVCILGIVGLFALDRDRNIPTSKGLWIPVVWGWILGSREVSKWLAAFGMGQAGTLSASSELVGNPLDRNLYTVLLMLGVIVLLRRGQQVGRILRANGPILLFFLYCAASALWSDYPGVSFKRWIKSVGDLVMVMIVLTDPDRLTAIKRFLTRTSFLLVPFSVLLVKYYHDLGQKFDPSTGKQNFIGVTSDKNALGATCLLFGLGCLWRFLAAYRDREGTQRTRHLIVHGTLLAMMMWLFSKANSMTSLLCFVLTSGLIVATSVPALARKRAVVNSLVVTVLAVPALLLFLDTGTGLLGTVGRDASLTGRTEIWKEALAKDTSPILGAGFESFWLGGPLDGPWSGRSWHVNEAHNGYLEVYLNLGWVGVVLLAAVIVAGYRNVIGLLRRDSEAGRLRLAYFVVELMYSFTEAGFRMMNLVWICFLLAAVVVPRDSTAEPAVPEWRTAEAGAYRSSETAGYKSLSSSLCE